MYFEIVKITDRDGCEKLDDEATNRLGRVVDVTPENIMLNSMLFMICVRPGIQKSIITSHVEDIRNNQDGIEIETENSIYYLKEVENL